MYSIVTENSKNTKLAGKNEKITATYLPIKKTCSDDCKLKDKVCYAQTGYVGIHNFRLEKQFKRKTHDQIIKEEARQIKKLESRAPIRLHVSGDCRTAKGASYLASAARSYLDKGGDKIYTYTHSWRGLKRNKWGKISVLASIENPKEVKQARKQGYASAIVVQDFPTDKAFFIENEKFIPCPNQTRNVTCSSCRLCFDADKLLARNINIAFLAHSSRKNNLVQITKKGGRNVS